MMLKENKKE